MKDLPIALIALARSLPFLLALLCSPLSQKVFNGTSALKAVIAQKSGAEYMRPVRPPSPTALS